MGGCSQSEGPACMMAVAAGLMKRQGERNLCRDSSDAPHQPEGGMEQQSVIWFDQIGIGDVAAVGGKNASLGEMIVALSSAGVRVPSGFATTAAAYREFVSANGLAPDIRSHLEAYRAGKTSLAEAGRARSEEHTSELQSLMRISYAVFCLKKTTREH